VDARDFTLALAESVVDRGGRLVRDEVVGFEKQRGEVTAVRTRTRQYAASAVVVAAGAWSRHLAADLGVRVPLDTERGYGVDLPDPGVTLRFPIVDMDHHFALSPSATGLRLAGTDELAGLEAPPNFARAEKLVRAARTLFPELRTEGGEQWMSYRPSMPDSLPVIGASPRYPNAHLAFGHGHIGFTLAAVTGQLVQELVEGKEPAVDLHPFRPTRFRVGRSRPGLPRAGR
jgi:D-amino-acid dehydrogenase